MCKSFLMLCYVIHVIIQVMCFKQLLTVFGSECSCDVLNAVRLLPWRCERGRSEMRGMRGGWGAGGGPAP